jgi:hypothetical protein
MNYFIRKKEEEKKDEKGIGGANSMKKVIPKATPVPFPHCKLQT